MVAVPLYATDSFPVYGLSFGKALTNNYDDDDASRRSP